MLTRLRLWLWEHRRRVLERRYVETGAAHRDARTAFLEHEIPTPGNPAVARDADTPILEA